MVCTAPEPSSGVQGSEPACQLLLFPRNHLDFASLVASYDLPQVLVLDYIVACRDKTVCNCPVGMLRADTCY